MKRSRPPKEEAAQAEHDPVDAFFAEVEGSQSDASDVAAEAAVEPAAQEQAAPETAGERASRPSYSEDDDPLRALMAEKSSGSEARPSVEEEEDLERDRAASLAALLGADAGDHSVATEIVAEPATSEEVSTEQQTTTEEAAAEAGRCDRTRRRDAGGGGVGPGIDRDQRGGIGLDRLAAHRPPGRKPTRPPRPTPSRRRAPQAVDRDRALAMPDLRAAVPPARARRARSAERSSISDACRPWRRTTMSTASC